MAVHMEQVGCTEIYNTVPVLIKDWVQNARFIRWRLSLKRNVAEELKTIDVKNTTEEGAQFC